MLFEKTLNYIKYFLKNDPNKNFIHKMKSVLIKLNDRALMLKAQLEYEKDEKKRKHIKIMLKVISKQQKKGEKLIQERILASHTSEKNRVIIRHEFSPRI